MDFFPRLESAIKANQLGSVLQIVSANELPTLGSSAAFRVTTSRGKFFFKFIDDTGKLRERIEYHKLIAPFLPLPAFVGTGEGCMILEFVDGPTLLHEVMNKNFDAFQHYEEALYYLCALWRVDATSSLGPAVSSNYLKNKKAEKPLMDFLRGAEDCLVVVQDIDSGLTTRQVFNETLSFLSQECLPHLTQGDARLDNVLLRQEKEVIFIDPRPGFVDWIDDLALFGWQRGFRLVEFTEIPKAQVRDGRLEINFVLKPSSFAKIAELLALSLAEEFVSQYNDFDFRWRWRYYSTVAAVALREIVSVQRRRQLRALGRELPEGAEYFWIAEAIRNFKLAREGYSNPK